MNGRESTETIKLRLEGILKEFSTSAFDLYVGKSEILKLSENEKDLFLGFSSVQRNLGAESRRKVSDQVVVNEADLGKLEIGEVVKLLFVLSFPLHNKDKFVKIVTSIFQTANLKELELLYKSLSLMPYPEEFTALASEAVRSNMLSVFESIAFHNPYPYYYFSENAWNQMVVKAVFLGKPVLQIVGLEKRRNQSLARIIVDLAHERWAAGRDIMPEAWFLVSPFLSGSVLEDFRRIMEKGDEKEKKAITLACLQSGTSMADELVRQFPIYYKMASSNEIAWATL